VVSAAWRDLIFISFGNRNSGAGMAGEASIWLAKEERASKTEAKGRSLSVKVIAERRRWGY